MAEVLTGKRLAIMNFITDCIRERGYPPSVREIGEAVGLASSATVHSHLAVLQKEGFLQRAIERRQIGLVAGAVGQRHIEVAVRLVERPVTGAVQ